MDPRVVLYVCVMTCFDDLCGGWMRTPWDRLLGRLGRLTITIDFQRLMTKTFKGIRKILKHYFFVMVTLNSVFSITGRLMYIA